MKTEQALAVVLRERAAAALDATHAVGERGPRTMGARERVAAYLDGVRTGQAGILTDLRWLEGLARARSRKAAARLDAILAAHGDRIEKVTQDTGSPRCDACGLENTIKRRGPLGEFLCYECLEGRQ